MYLLIVPFRNICDHDICVDDLPREKVRHHLVAGMLPGAGPCLEKDESSAQWSELSVKSLGVVLNRELTFPDYVIGRLTGLYRLGSLLLECAKLQLILSIMLSDFPQCKIYLDPDMGNNSELLAQTIPPFILIYGNINTEILQDILEEDTYK
ncbi:hypothetical protein J6590_075886 [Homalodisca vitripennis]|nr:hypothetical protein J6590_075886 [Homalodisca vitripennis]